MNLLCNLSGHTVPKVSLENQGFQFSRCTRCSHDMIRSSTSTDRSWKPVPPSFQVAWRSVDLAIFEHRSRVGAQVAAARQAMLGVASAALIGFSVMRWRAGDSARRVGRQFARVLTGKNRVIRGGHVRLLKLRWNVVVQVTVRRDIGFDHERLVA
ncbi:hypothetical protein [Sphingomonas sp. ERG5]|uniref:hypothetical protein n=1 Tax=Sphingomonas sp. ERG5 TaxID=1381597 RepID=UPI001269C736|nr:hypothetical protein [Sphingomonas sp. ERG5]